MYEFISMIHVIITQESTQRESQRQRASVSSQSQSSQRTQSTPRPSQTQRANSSQSQRSPEETTEDIDRLVSEVIQYFLVMEQKRFPVRKADINKIFSGKAKSFKAVMAKAGKYLDEVSHRLFYLWVKNLFYFLGFWLFYP